MAAMRAALETARRSGRSWSTATTRRVTPHNHPLVFAALMHLNEEIDQIRARLSPEAFAALQAESRRAIERRAKGKKNRC
jgi:hypothetical protein